MIPTTVVKKLTQISALKSGGQISRYMQRKARLKSHQKVRWDRKYAASATIKKLVGSKKNLGSENRTQKTIHRRPQPINGGLKEKFGVRKSDSKIKITALNFLAVSRNLLNTK